MHKFSNCLSKWQEEKEDLSRLSIELVSRPPIGFVKGLKTWLIQDE